MVRSKLISFHLSMVILLGSVGCLTQGGVTPETTNGRPAATLTQSEAREAEAPATGPAHAADEPTVPPTEEAESSPPEETPTGLQGEETSDYGSEEAPSLVTVETRRVEIIEMTPESTKPSPINPAVQKWIDVAKDDLAGRLSIASEQIELIAFESVVWPDAGLGCPRPGMSYTQVQVDGFRIQLSVAGKIYNYHGGGNRGPFLCEQSGPAAKGTGIAPDELLPPPGGGTD